MKKIISKSIFLLSLLLLLGACEEKEFVELNSDANTVVNLSASAVLLTEDTATDTALTVSWIEPDFGFEAAPTYTILIDFPGGDYSTGQLIPVGTELEKVFTEGELNGKLLSLGVSPNEPTDVVIAVQTKLSGFQTMMSEAVTLNVTAFSSLLDLSTNWGVVGSGTPGGWGNPDILDLPFYTTDVPGELVAYVTLRDGEIKFRTDNAWTLNYGDTGVDGTLEEGGDNIAVSAGTYMINLNLNDLTYVITPYTWGLVGSATVNGWDGPDFMMQYNPYQNDWKAAVTLLDGEVKFRLNNDWGTNYGGTGTEGPAELGGGNIVVTAGNYLVTFDLENLEYSFEATDLWGLVGSATPNGWDGPDTKFTPNFGIDEGTFYINGIELIDGDIKVRQNDAWAVNWGDTGNDGTLEEGGTDIPVVAGTYNVKVDFAASPPTINLYAW